MSRDALQAWTRTADLRGSDFVFPRRSGHSPHLSTRQYARMVHRWVREIGLDSSCYGTHTVRRTKAAPIYRRTKNLRAVQLLLGDSELESTVRNLGIEVDDALESSAGPAWRPKWRPITPSSALPTIRSAYPRH